MTLNLFGEISEHELSNDSLGPGTAILHGFALPAEVALLKALDGVVEKSLFRHMVTPAGFRMSVAMTNCGALGWVTNRSGYRYDANDPESQRPWPQMPDCFMELATTAAKEAGFPAFAPDACLVNRYEPGSRLTLHQDKNERDFGQPIVSVSLGLPAVFLFGGDERADKTIRVPVAHGDVVVWGDPARLRYHGVMPLKMGAHPSVGAYRVNLTFRKAA